jgi:KAP family P-loop domain
MADAAPSNGAPLLRGSGFDAPGVDRDRDYLNRWPFAGEIYGIVKTSPAEWSVRIGVYGEWGTGKTTVLNYLAQLARADDHVVVPFNPWQFTSLDELWKEFVKSLFQNLERDLGKPLPGAKGRTAKRVSGTVVAALPQFIRLWREDAGKAAETGLSYVRRFMAFGPDDLKQLQEGLGGRRIIILIDDLDRTDQSLVPGMLFAFKEIMDVRGFAFAVPLLPANPRAIRQFVRLLTLLGPQIDRHLEREIHWPILLAANVLKVRFPKIAPALLGNKPFWGSMRESIRFNESDADPRKQLIADETEKLASAHGLDNHNKHALERGIEAIAEKMTPWLGIGDQQLLY